MKKSINFTAEYAKTQYITAGVWFNKRVFYTMPWLVLPPIRPTLNFFAGVRLIFRLPDPEQNREESKQLPSTNHEVPAAWLFV